jgi:hypothetical protein
MMDQSSVAYQTSQSMSRSFAIVPKKINTIFDVPEQFLTLSPLSYNQYQVL